MDTPGHRNHFMAPTLMRALALAWETGSWQVMEAGMAVMAGPALGPCSHGLWAVRAHSYLGAAAFVAMFVLMWFPFLALLASTEPCVKVWDRRKCLRGLFIPQEGEGVLIPLHTCPKETACPMLTMPGQLLDEATLCC